MTERKAHRKPEGADTVVDVRCVRFGSDPFPVIAGCRRWCPRQRAAPPRERACDRSSLVSFASSIRHGIFRKCTAPRTRARQASLYRSGSGATCSVIWIVFMMITIIIKGLLRLDGAGGSLRP